MREMRPNCSILAIALAACAISTDGLDPDGAREDIYGADSRRERYQVTSNKLRAAARSSAALFGEDVLVRDSSSATWSVPDPPTLREIYELCPGQRFSSQPRVSFCSATLIAPDLILTAGHCMDPRDDGRSCADTVVMFDFAYDAAPGSRPMRIIEDVPDEDVYRCKRVLASVNTGWPAAQDFAVVRLDRAVVGRAPVEVDWTGERSIGTAVHVIGHPSGLPQKLASGAVTSDSDESDDILEHDADTLQGNSGSGTFDAGGRLIGDLVWNSGEPYTWDEDRECYVVSKCGVDVDCTWHVGTYRASAIATKLTPSLRAELGVP